MKLFLRATVLAALGLALALQAAAQSTPATAGDVVINKIMNKGSSPSDNAPDAVEILVISDNVDLRGCFIKDFSTDGSADGGGIYQFGRFSPTWNNLRAGTLIYLTNGTPNTIDSSYAPLSGDWVIQVSMPNATAPTGLFPNFPTGNNLRPGDFRIGNDEIVMLMPATTDGQLYQGGNSANPVNPFIHCIFSGSVREFNATDAKVVLQTYLAGGGTGDTLRSSNEIIPNDPGNIAYATTPNTSSDDFEGTGAATAAEGATIDGVALAFGTGNTTTNRNFIDALRSTVTSIIPGFATQSTIELEAFPKPVRLGTQFNLKFGLAGAGRVTVELLDLSGRKIATLQPSTFMASGDHALQLAVPEALNVDFGLYLVRLHAEGTGKQGYVKLPVYR